ncbi:tetratricopeptide repeat protein [Helicobacter sp. T3_23-1059]
MKKLCLVFLVAFLCIVGFVGCAAERMPFWQKLELQVQCDRGYAEVCYQLGGIFEREKEYDFAITYYGYACNNKDKKACDKIKDLAPKEPLGARLALFEACNGKLDDKEYFLPACLELQKMYVKEGKNISGNIDEIYKMCKWDKFAPACDELDNAVNKYVAEKIQNIEIYDRDFRAIISNLSKYCTQINAKSACKARENILAVLDKRCITDNTDGESCVLLADFYADIDTDETYIERFKKVAQKGCDLGNADACYLLAQYFYAQKGKEDFNTAREFGKKACETLEDSSKCLELAQLLQKDIVDNKDNEDRQVEAMLFYLKTGCDKINDYIVCQELAMIYNEGLYDKHKLNKKLINQKQALHYYDKACALGIGCDYLGENYLFGEVVGGKRIKKDMAKAKHYFTKDCDNKGDNYWCGDDEYGNNVCDASPSCCIKRMNIKEMIKIDDKFFKQIKVICR